MPPSPADFDDRIKLILQSVQVLPDEAKAPILHCRRTVADIWGALDYFERLVPEAERKSEEALRHFGRVYVMALVSLIETFERFIKELAAECVDSLVDVVVDDRFNAFPVQGAVLASHFGSASAGKALCESSIWLDCKDINDRFRKLLADPHKAGDFYLFPKDGSQQPIDQHWRFDLMTFVWQLRHTAVHNVGIITKSDAVKLRVLAKTKVDAPRQLAPSKENLLWLKMFLDDTAELCNQRIAHRLAELLTLIYGTSMP